jgi:hypothetical protein
VDSSRKRKRVTIATVHRVLNHGTFTTVSRRATCGICGVGNVGPSQTPLLRKNGMPRKFGVKLTRVMPPVTRNETPSDGEWKNDAIPTSDSERCVCGRTYADCSDYWDKRLGVSGHEASSSGGVETQYQRNLRVMREFEVRGEDPYCFDAWLTSLGYVSQWTPKLQ